MIYRDFTTGEERQITIQRGEVVVVALEEGRPVITRETKPTTVWHGLRSFTVVQPKPPLASPTVAPEVTV